LENIPERTEDVFEPPKAVEPGTLQSIMPIGVVDATFLRIMEDFIGFRRHLEFLLGFFISGVSVRVIFERELSIRLLELFLISLA
jgi:hypothetical protein